jgi:hypothetical protein
VPQLGRGRVGGGSRRRSGHEGAVSFDQGGDAAFPGLLGGLPGVGVAELAGDSGRGRNLRQLEQPARGTGGVGTEAAFAFGPGPALEGLGQKQAVGRVRTAGGKEGAGEAMGGAGRGRVAA